MIIPSVILSAVLLAIYIIPILFIFTLLLLLLLFRNCSLCRGNGGSENWREATEGWLQYSQGTDLQSRLTFAIGEKS